MLSSQSIVSSSKTTRLCNPWGGWWIGHWKTTWLTVWSSAPHSQAAEAAMHHLCQGEFLDIPDLCKQERKSLTPVRRRDESTESRSALQPFRIPSVIRPQRRTPVIIVRWTDELLCSKYNKCFDLRCRAFPRDGQESAEWSRCPGSMTRPAIEIVWLFCDEAQQVGCLRE